ncbi:MAG: T9SS type A sorting domain-containing protein [Saprospiraceae bacterium]|nr:T9SS type A sorting domain-containing protein [Saprospiraceae bacterium]
MKKHLFLARCILWATLSLPLITGGRLLSQNVECGTPDISISQLHAILEQLPQGASFNPQSSPWTVPIWFYHLRRSDGSSAYQNFDPESAISPLNQYFGGLFEFSICGTTNIDDDQFAVMDLSANSPDFADLVATIDLLNQPASESCVRVFLTGEPGIIAGTLFPVGYALDRLQFNENAGIFVGITDQDNFEVWAHEIGHYFGLPHTFADPTNQYVHDVNTPVIIGGVQYSCFQTGDGFCDTPADIIDCTYSQLNCSATPVCSTTDPLGIPYAPDPTLLMSYYGGCRNRFSNEQRQVMRTLYLLHPNYAAILNAPNECLIPNFGIIERNCVDVQGPAADVSPIAAVPVEVRDVNNACNGQNNLTDAEGKYVTEPCLLTSPLRKVLPGLNHSTPLNGVDVADLVVINAHLLGPFPFQNPFQMIAADANNSGTITSFDIVTIRRVILGADPNFMPEQKSWRYVPKLCTETQSFHEQFWGDVDLIMPGLQLNPFIAVFTDPFQGFTRHYKSATPNLPNNDSWMDHVSLNTDEAATHNQAAWSFTGIKVGDVNCTADVDGFQSEDPDGAFTTLPHLPVLPNQIFTLQVKAVGSTPIAAWQFGIDFAHEALQVMEVQPGNSNEVFSLDNFGLTRLSEGEFRALNFAENGLAQNLNNKTLFKLKMKALQPISDIGQHFQLKNSVLPELFLSASGAEVETIGLQLEVSAGLGMAGGNTGGAAHLNTDAYQIAVYPVPFTSDISIDFFLPEEKQVHFSIFDAYGRTITELRKVFPKGVNTAQLDDLASCPSGIYWYSFVAEGQKHFGRIVKK